jgi:serine/threonine protein phosphatase PrpC
MARPSSSSSWAWNRRQRIISALQHSPHHTKSPSSFFSWKYLIRTVLPWLFAIVSLYQLGELIWRLQVQSVHPTLQQDSAWEWKEWKQPNEYSIQRAQGYVGLLQLSYKPSQLPLQGNYRYPNNHCHASSSTVAGTDSGSNSNTATDTASIPPCTLSFPISYPLNPSLLSTTAKTMLPSYAMTRKGKKDGIYPFPLPNQDRSLAISLGPHDKVWMLADGHGENGQVSAELGILTLPYYLQQEYYQNHVEPVQALHNAFLSGCTAVVVWQLHSVVYIASAGDSTAMLAAYYPATLPSATSTVQLVLSAVHHKPADPLERARIEAAGGMVWLPPDEVGGSSRVVLRDPHDPMLIRMALAMSRCLGDVDGKVDGTLTAEPSIVSLNLTTVPNAPRFFVVVASDGVMDHAPQDYVLQTVAEALFASSTSSRGEAVATAVHSILQTAAQGWDAALQGTYRDDMTLMISPIEID